MVHTDAYSLKTSGFKALVGVEAHSLTLRIKPRFVWPHIGERSHSIRQPAPNSIVCGLGGCSYRAGIIVPEESVVSSP